MSNPGDVLAYLIARTIVLIFQFIMLVVIFIVTTVVIGFTLFYLAHFLFGPFN